jgi:alanine dehydrogenase
VGEEGRRTLKMSMLGLGIVTMTKFDMAVALSAAATIVELNFIFASMRVTSALQNLR